MWTFIISWLFAFSGVSQFQFFLFYQRDRRFAIFFFQIRSPAWRPLIIIITTIKINIFLPTETVGTRHERSELTARSFLPSRFDVSYPRSFSNKPNACPLSCQHEGPQEASEGYLFDRLTAERGLLLRASSHTRTVASFNWHKVYTHTRIHANKRILATKSPAALILARTSTRRKETHLTLRSFQFYLKFFLSSFGYIYTYFFFPSNFT